MMTSIDTVALMAATIAAQCDHDYDADVMAREALDLYNAVVREQTRRRERQRAQVEAATCGVCADF